MDPSPQVDVSNSFKATIMFDPSEDMVEEQSSVVVQPASMNVLTANATEVTPAVHLYQIAYSAATPAAVEPGYLVLDNLTIGASIGRYGASYLRTGLITRPSMASSAPSSETKRC